MLEVVLCALSFWGMDPEPNTCTNLLEIPLNEDVVECCHITREQQDKWESGKYYYHEYEDGTAQIHVGTD